MPDVDRDAGTSDTAPPPASSVQQPETAVETETQGALFAGVTLLRADDLNVGAYLASGAFGQVYRGVWNGEAVALKQIDFDHARKNLPMLSREDIAEALQWEVSRLATTSHPNLVQLHGVGQKDGKTYLVLEFCEGGSLQRALEQGNIRTKGYGNGCGRSLMGWLICMARACCIAT